MKPSLSHSLILAAVLAMPVLGQTTQPTPVEAPSTKPAMTPEVAALLQQLNDPDPAKVAQAKAKLIALGDVAKPALEQFLKHRNTADDVLATIETNKVASATLITLKIKDGTVDDVLNALTKQCGYPMKMYNRAAFRARGNNADPQTFTLDYDNQPFWDVLKDVCAKTGISPYNDGQNRRGLTFMPAANMGGSMFNCPISSSGAALCAMQALSRNSSITFGQNSPPNFNFNAQMLIMFEPKVRISSYYSSPQIDEAVDDKGNSLVNKAQQGSSSPNSASRQTQLGLGLNLIYPQTNPGTKIVKLRGKVRLNVATRAESVEVSDLTKEQTQKSPSGRRITVRGVKPQNDNENNRQYNLQVTFYRDGTDQQKFAESLNIPTVRLLDKDGRELQYQHNSRNDSNENEANQTMVFYRYGRNEGREEDVGEPVKVIWDVTTDTKEISVPFEFTDLPMP